MNATCSKTSRHRRELRAGESQRRIVDDVQDVDAIGPQHAPDVRDELAGREVPGHGRAGERITHDQVVAVVRLGGEVHTAIAEDDLEVVARHEPELLTSGLEHDRVELEDPGVGAWSRRLDVAGHRESTAADVQRVDRLARRRQTVDDVAEQARVGELEPGRISQVDVGVPQRVHPQLDALGVPGVLVDVDAEVGALALASLRGGGRPGHREAARDQREDGDPGPPRATERRGEEHARER